MLKIIVMAMLALGCVGCFSIPDTEEELRSNAYKIDQYCSPLSFADTYSVVARNTARCHAQNEDALVPAAGLFIPLSTQDIVKGEITSPNQIAKILVEYKNPVEGGFLQAIDIMATESCPAEVSVYVLNDTKKWLSASASVLKWLNGDSESCFALF
ncbi:hypothetical protein [Alteromonas lipolytica]|uniref:Lipoprotein n=1 Tax=Alteromonas lipolytica TaxID=1856405 RepID=A0A1E8FFR5_9ALTE|nr:hypothetical protein [Alteromonas lipolytica]OFI34760.1 hypothetical protein BFC17_14365 [Alteromonas lipolytica]GGF53772.1 hypothetical protein GCM10011338_02410 [Alteromonas lipolytica]